MSANFEAKKVVVAEIKEKIQNAKSVVFVKFNGLTVAEDTELRREFRKNNVEYKVLKNTLIRKAFNDLGVPEFDEDLNGPTSVAFGADETGAAKVIVDADQLSLAIGKMGQNARLAARLTGCKIDIKALQATLSPAKFA